MSLWKMISSPYGVQCNLRVFCRLTLHFGNSAHEVSGSVIKFLTFDIRCTEMSVWEKVEVLPLVFVR